MVATSRPSITLRSRMSALAGWWAAGLEIPAKAFPSMRFTMRQLPTRHPSKPPTCHFCQCLDANRAAYHLLVPAKNDWVFMRRGLIVVIRFTLPLLFVFPFVFPPLRAQTSLPDHPQSQQPLPDSPRP